MLLLFIDLLILSMLVYSLCRNFRSCKNSAYRGNVHNVNDLSNLVSAFFLDSEQVWICCSDIVILCSFLHRNLFIKFIDCNKISVINSMIDHIYLSKWIFPTLYLYLVDYPVAVRKFIIYFFCILWHFICLCIIILIFTFHVIQCTWLLCSWQTILLNFCFQ